MVVITQIVYIIVQIVNRMGPNKSHSGSDDSDEEHTKKTIIVKE